MLVAFLGEQQHIIGIHFAISGPVDFLEVTLFTDFAMFLGC